MNDGIQYAKLEEAYCIYDFLAGLNPKFDIECILERRPLPSLVKACYEVCLEEERMNAMSILTTLATDFAVVGARSSTRDNK